MKIRELKRASSQPCREELPGVPTHRMTLPGDKALLEASEQVQVSTDGLDLTSLLLPSPSTVASHSMSSVRLLLMVLLLAGPGGVLASEILGRDRRKCGGTCNASAESTRGAGCTCVFATSSYSGTCMRESRACGGLCGDSVDIECAEGCTCVFDTDRPFGVCRRNVTKCGDYCGDFLDSKCCERS
nr:uncharacterized protein LOC129382093 isoform X2 [Dermacentor andersoni]